jgi:response regulator RpfG family c-di-GMP phosphodiesterase
LDDGGAESPESPRQGYALVVGPVGPDRDWAALTLQEAGLEVAAATEDEILGGRDWVPPTLLVLDDHATRDERKATQKRLQKHPSFVGVPLLILAYDADIDSYTGALTKGAAGYLVKPVNADELTTAARKLVDWKRNADRSEKRRRLRRPLLMKVEVDIRARKVRVPGEIVDASGAGCRIELGEELQPGELVRVILHGHEDSTHVALGAEVRWHRLAPSGMHVVGLRFTGTTALLAGKLLGFASTGLT